MSKVSDQLKTKSLLTAVIYFVAGLLLCLAVIDVDGLLSIMLGVLLVLLGAVLLIASIVREKRVSADVIVPSSFLLAVGIAFFLWAFPFTGIMALFLTAIGGILLIDAILAIANKQPTAVWLVELIIGAIALALGICLLAIPDFRRFASLILGIILIIYAVLIAIEAFSKKK